MPIAETPLAQVLVEVATKCTGDPKVLPLVGELTVTVANAEAADKRIQQNIVLMCAPEISFVFWIRDVREPDESDKLQRSLAGV